MEESATDEEAELAIRFEDDAERLDTMHRKLRDLEGHSDFVPFESGILNNMYNNWLAIGLEISSKSVAQSYIIEKMAKLMKGLEDARKQEDIVPHQGPWPWIDQDKPFPALNEDAKEALGIEKD